jgi:hypothetical protein
MYFRGIKLFFEGNLIINGKAWLYFWVERLLLCRILRKDDFKSMFGLWKINACIMHLQFFSVLIVLKKRFLLKSRWILQSISIKLHWFHLLYQIYWIKIFKHIENIVYPKQRKVLVKLRFNECIICSLFIVSVWENWLNRFKFCYHSDINFNLSRVYNYTSSP